jgi:Fe-S-cluster-containing dehydrogenase component
MKRYGMLIDLRLCIGCNACTVACKAEHGTQPEVFWCKVLEKEEGTYPAVKRLFVPVLCNHCDNPPCEAVCPTEATYKTEEGLVLIDYDKCMGCSACILACPYDARTFIEEERFYFPGTPIPHSVDELRGRKGIVQKCTLCSDRLKRGEEPACVEVCPPSCRIFGDLNDPASAISQALKENSCFRMLESLGTNPATYYIQFNKKC